MSLIGNPNTLRDLRRKLEALPKRLAQDVAARVAPVITGMAQSAYASGKTVYDEGRPLGVNGNALDLVITGDAQEGVKFNAVGTIVRAVMPVPYAKFLVGKYKVLPMGALPEKWSRAIGDEVRAEVSKQLGATQ